jgi:hypothetical protein
MRICARTALNRGAIARSTAEQVRSVAPLRFAELLWPRSEGIVCFNRMHVVCAVAGPESYLVVTLVPVLVGSL